MKREKQIQRISRTALAIVWIWHGLVPKLIVQHPDETAPLVAMGMEAETAWMIVTITGIGEILFGLLILFLPRSVWPLWLTVIAMSGLLLGVLFTTPEAIGGAFNPVTLNLLMIGMAAIALFSDDKRDHNVNG